MPVFAEAAFVRGAALGVHAVPLCAREADWFCGLAPAGFGALEAVERVCGNQFVALFSVPAGLSAGARGEAPEGDGQAMKLVMSVPAGFGAVVARWFPREPSPFARLEARALEEAGLVDARPGGGPERVPSMEVDRSSRSGRFVWWDGRILSAPAH